MSEAIISVENLGKKYRISHQPRQRYTALRDVIAQKCAAPFRGLFHRGAPSPPQSGRGQGEVSNSSQLPSSRTSPSEDFWALKDVSFEVRQGEVVGVIRRHAVPEAARPARRIAIMRLRVGWRVATAHTTEPKQAR